MEAYTISATQDRHAEAHSRREYTPFSAEKSLEDKNIVIYDCGDDRKHFNDFFRPVIERYNEKQKRADRKKDLDYLEALESGKEGYGRGAAHEKPFNHDVIQVGNRDTNGVTKRTFEVDHWRKLKRDGKYDEAADYVKQHLNDAKVLEDIKEIYIEIANEILENKDHLYDGILVHGLTIHWDEPSGTPHLDFRYTFYTEGEKTGLDTRVSQRKALSKLGFKSDKERTALEKFRESLKDRIEEKLIERGYERDVKNEKRKHLSTITYEMEQRAKEAEVKKVEAEAQAKKVTAEAEKKLKEAEAKEEEIKKDKKKFENDKGYWEKDFKKHIKKVNNEVSKVETKLKTEKKKQEEKQKELNQKEKEFQEQLEEWREWYLDLLYDVNPDWDPEDDNIDLKDLQEELMEEFQYKEDKLEAQQKVLEKKEKLLEEKEQSILKAQKVINSIELTSTNKKYYQRVKIPVVFKDGHVENISLHDLNENADKKRDKEFEEKKRQLDEFVSDMINKNDFENDLYK